MAVSTVVVETQIPKDVFLTLQAHGVTKGGMAIQSQRLLALRYYQDRVLSLGKAAQLAEMGRWEFINFLSDNNVPVIDYTDEELAAEFAAVDELEELLNQ